MSSVQIVVKPRFWKGLCFSLVAAMLLALLAACGGGSGSGSGKPTITIGSKDFTEQVIVANMVSALLENAGYGTELRTNLSGTAVVHQALLSEEIDTYLEYTGTGLTAILKQKTKTDPQEVYNIVKEAYAEEFQVSWLKPWGFNNTYALVMRKSQADELGIKSISDLKKHAAELTLGSDREFLNRPDGMPGIEKTYGFSFGDSKSMDAGLMYTAAANGEVDVISGYATDGRIPALDLVILEDDKHFFPPYFAAPILRQATLEQHPEIREILNQLAGKIDDTTMANLNKQVDEEDVDAAKVAQDFLKEQGLLD